jgi:hypothetical protein
MTNSDSNNTDKSQSSIDRFIKTPQRRLAANARPPPTPTEDLHEKTSGTKKSKSYQNKLFLKHVLYKIIKYFMHYR